MMPIWFDNPFRLAETLDPFDETGVGFGWANVA